jgi:pilus assembly protein CpaB
MERRTLLLIAALVVAALGTTMVFLYVNGVNDRALAEQDPVQVLVATSAIDAGTTAGEALAAGAIESKEISRSSAADNALSDVTPIEDQVALSPIFAGEQILTNKFGAAGSSTNLPIPDGKLAISVQLDDPARLAGFLAPGSKVAIFLTINAAGKEKSQLLLPEVQVLSADGKTLAPAATGDTANASQAPAALVTLAVDQAQYQKVFFASSHGQMSFALLGKDAKLSPSVPGTDIDNLFAN